MSQKPKIILLLLLLCLTGIVLFVIGAPHRCYQEEILKRISHFHSFAEGGNGYKYVYIINFISLPCRSLVYYRLIREKEVVFYLPPDYNQNDLDNFRLNLGIAPHHMIMSVPLELREAVQPCLRHPRENLLIQLDYPKKIQTVWRF